MQPGWFKNPVKTISTAAEEAARARQKHLTKPLGSLGMLESLAVRLAGMQGRANPSADLARIVVFAADHGVAVANVSTYSPTYSVEMVRCISRGQSAINVLARRLNADLEVVDVGLATPPGLLPGLVSQRVGAGTKDIRSHPAMTDVQFSKALRAGQDAVKRAVEARAEIFIGGALGVGKSTAAACVACNLLGGPPEAMAGPGSGLLDEAGLARKAEAIHQAIQLHAPFVHNPLQAIQHLGGFEMAALCGAFVACAQMGLPALVDGFLASVSALAAATVKPEVKHWLLFAHRSAEPGQYSILTLLQASPILDLDIRLGEGAGAAMALPILRLACSLHNEIATLEESSCTFAGEGS